MSESKDVQKHTNKQNSTMMGIYVKGYRSQLKEEAKKGSKLEQLERKNNVGL